MQGSYYLAIETKSNSYFPINISDLSINPIHTINSLEELDSWTINYTSYEIMAAIKEANLLEIYNNMPLVVVYYQNKDIRKMPALTKDVAYDFKSYLKDNYCNKEFKNKIDNFLRNKIDNDLYDKIKNCNNVDIWIKSISKLKYKIERKLYFYLYEK